jgi:hypothetical protein
MADTPIKHKKLQIKIKDIVDHPKMPDHTLVSFEIDDGDSAGPYHRAFAFKTPDHPLSIEQLAANLATRPPEELSRPADPFAALRDAMEHQETFDIITSVSA